MGVTDDDEPVTGTDQSSSLAPTTCDPERRNDRSLVTDDGITVKNRQSWVIEGVGADDSVTIADDERGRVTLPPHYVAVALSLGYASRAMGGQGRTVDHSLVLVDGRSTRLAYTSR